MLPLAFFSLINTAQSPVPVFLAPGSELRSLVYTEHWRALQKSGRAFGYIMHRTDSGHLAHAVAHVSFTVSSALACDTVSLHITARRHRVGACLPAQPATALSILECLARRCLF
jgi:hypothetical protein